MAAEIGVDRLCWELTDHPEDMFSRRFVPGAPELAAIRHEIWDDNNLGNAIPGATPRAQIDVSGPLPRLPLDRPGRPAADRPHARSATCRPARSRPRRATGAGSSASARSCATATARVVNRDFERAWLPATLQPAASGRRADDAHGARQAGPLRVEVRSGQRGDRLVRGVRVADDDEDAGGDLRSGFG